MKALSRTILPLLLAAVAGAAAAKDSPQLARGKYLMESVVACGNCHTPRDDKGMLVMARLGAGGMPFKGPWGESVSRNLTPHETGLKAWSDAEIARAIREGVDRHGQRLRPPMAFDFYRNIRDDDMRALIAFLRSLPPQAPGTKP